MIGRLDLGSRILPYTSNEISRRCQKKEDSRGRILMCDSAIKRQKTDLDFIQTASIGCAPYMAGAILPENQQFAAFTLDSSGSGAFIQLLAPLFYACGIRGNPWGR